MADHFDHLCIEPASFRQSTPKPPRSDSRR
jgi:hypothetical protein